MALFKGKMNLLSRMNSTSFKTPTFAVSSLTSTKQNFAVRKWWTQETPGLEKEWFREDEALSSKYRESRTKGHVHVVFLEGAPGTGKAEMIQRLHKLGYATFSQPFLPLLLKTKNEQTASEMWKNEYQTKLEKLKKDHFEGKSLKDGIIFVNRSPLSRLILSHSSSDFSHLANHLAEEKKKITKETEGASSFILCESDIVAMMERTGQRLTFAETEEEKTFREKLGETNRQFLEEKKKKLFENLKNVFVDGSLATSSVKQSSVHVLRLFGIHFSYQSNPFQNHNNTKSSPPPHNQNPIHNENPYHTPTHNANHNPNHNHNHNHNHSHHTPAHK